MLLAFYFASLFFAGENRLSIVHFYDILRQVFHEWMMKWEIRQSGDMIGLYAGGRGRLLISKLNSHQVYKYKSRLTLSETEQHA